MRNMGRRFGVWDFILLLLLLLLLQIQTLSEDPTHKSREPLWAPQLNVPKDSRANKH